MPQIRILLVDDSDVFLNVEERWLLEDPRAQIVGRAHSGREAIEQASRLTTDLVLMDVTMRDMNGLDATRRIKAAPGAPRIVVLTVEIGPEFRAAAKAAGADGFLSKAQLSTKLLPLLRTLFPDTERKRPVKESPKRSRKRLTR